jgi:hypothetical protein
MKHYCGHIECKWTHNHKLELVYFRQKYGDELFKAINLSGEITTNVYESHTLPDHRYKRVDFYVEPKGGKATTVFMLMLAWRLEREPQWAHSI